MDDISVKNLISKNNFKIVLEADQLKQQPIRNVFKSYKEDLINVLEYNPVTNDWDSRCVN